MATVYARGGRWYLNWSEHGRQYRKSLGKITRDDAEKFCKGKEFELATGRPVFLASALFEDHLQRYLDWHAVQYRDSHFRVRQISEQCFGDFVGRALSQISPQDIERWKASRQTRVGWNRLRQEAIVSSETASKELRTLKAVLNKAVEWGELERSPAKNVKAPKNLNNAPIHWYARPQLAKLYRGTRYGPIWRLMANAGLRRAEALQLKWQDVNQKGGYLNVLSTESERTKSGKWRQVPLSDAGRAAVASLKRQTGKTDYVVPHMTGPSLSRAFLTDAKARGLPGSLHSLRHSYGAHMVMAGVPLRTLQVLMGHASFVTTERYAHVGKDHLRDQAKLVNL
jgi:integrase